MVSATPLTRSVQEQARVSGLQVSVRNSTAQVVNLALQGRHSRAILDALFLPVTGRPAVAELARFRFTVARHGGDNGLPVLISRTGFTGELGYEVFCAPRDAEQLFDLMMAEGARHGIAPVGMHALDTLRIEAGLPLAGAEFDGRTTPYEAGIGFNRGAEGQGDRLSRPRGAGEGGGLGQDAAGNAGPGRRRGPPAPRARAHRDDAGRQADVDHPFAPRLAR
jgi:glycine cleavage system aminomethyltransferase T